MSDNEWQNERDAHDRLVMDAPRKLKPLLMDLNIGKMNGDVMKDSTMRDKRSELRIIFCSTYYILGLYDIDELQDAYAKLGVQQPKKWAKKLSEYVARRL